MRLACTLPIENGFILNSKLSIESKFDSTKFVELGLGSSRSSKSKFGEFGDDNPNITVLSVSVFSLSFEFISIIEPEVLNKNTVIFTYFSIP